MKLDSLLMQIGKNSEQKIPPVEQWHPNFSGDIAIEIKADGSWWHEGVQFERQELINLFASILKKESDEYFLVTPVEKWRISVADCPLFVSLIEKTATGISLLTTTADRFDLDAEHPLQMSKVNGVEVAEVRVRGDLWARFMRNAWYELLTHAQEDTENQVTVESHGLAFRLN